MLALSMKTIYEIREENTKTLAERVGGISKLAQKIEKAQSLVSRYIGKSKNKTNIGDETAREIEERFELERGWLDNNHQANIPEEVMIDLRETMDRFYAASTMKDLQLKPSEYFDMAWAKHAAEQGDESIESQLLTLVSSLKK